MPESPNILVIMSDQHNPRLAGCYGDTIVRTPNIDRLSREGIRLDRCYTAAPVCVPARMSFMTGRRPCENEVVENFDILSSQIMTWPTRLREKGYHTALIGRMHFDGPDQWHGFETTSEELRHWRDGNPVESAKFTEQVPVSCYWSARESMEKHSGSGTTFVQYRDELVCEKAGEWLRAYADSKDERPFAAVVGLYQPHPPYIGRKDLYEYYYSRVKATEDSLAMTPPYFRDFFERFRDWTKPTLLDQESNRRSRAAYYANCEHLDEMLGNLLRVVDETGLAENTLVIYCSDHGDMLGQKGVWGKCCFYDESVRVPLIARLPGTIPAGTTTQRNSNLRDLANTFCEIAGVEPLAGSDGKSLWSLWRGETPSTPDRTESEIVHGPIFDLPENVPAKMLCEGDWKLWCYYLDGREHYSFFNLATDPDELVDRIDDSAQQERIAAMKILLWQNWEPEKLKNQAVKRRADRSEIDQVWHNISIAPGYPVPSDLDAEVQTPNTLAARR